MNALAITCRIWTVASTRSDAWTRGRVGRSPVRGPARAEAFGSLRRHRPGCRSPSRRGIALLRATTPRSRHAVPPLQLPSRGQHGHATPTRGRPATAVQLVESRFDADACRHRSARFRRRDSGGGVSRSVYLLRRDAAGSCHRENGALLVHGDVDRLLPVRDTAGRLPPLLENFTYVAVEAVRTTSPGHPRRSSPRAAGLREGMSGL